MGPDYKVPSTLIPTRWTTSPAGGLTIAGDKAAIDLVQKWWTTFKDPMLCDLIGRAKEGNHDLRQARARISEARAQRAMVAAGLFPLLGNNGSASQSKSSKEAGNGLASDFYSLGFDASWELDVFGGKRRSLESATASWQASEESYRDVLVSLLAEVALNYVEIRSNQKLLAITESTVTTRNETYQLTRWRRESGLTTQLDVDQARLSLEQAQAQVPSLRTSLEQAKHRLCVLLGQAPGALDAMINKPKPIPLPPAKVAIGIPADLLRRRPDVRTAERKLAAQTAEIGVAEAELYPSFALSGSIGLEALAFSHLWSAGAWASQTAAKSAWTVFNAGSLRQNIKVQNARQEEALSQYENTVLTALKDVEGALVAYSNEKTRRSALAEAVKSGQSAFELARDQYASGLVSFQTVVDIQQSLLSVQDQLTTSEATVTSDLIRLYKALGGGWDLAELSKPKAGSPL